MDPLYGFVFLGLFSPGPNIVLLTASGARFGFRATVPHLLGVAVGVGITSGLTGLGIGAILLANPGLTFALKLAAAAWILRMAWGLWRANPLDPKVERERPFRFVEAVLFQWVNPKIWATALAASTAYAAGLSPLGEAFRLATAFSGINLFVCLFWTWAGTLMVYLLKTPTAWRVFNRSMALALAGFSAMVLL